MVWIWFFLAAIVTIFSAGKLSFYADIIGKQTKLGGLWIGSILLAAATSLPELATSISAALMNTPNIAVGNVFGSNIFNILNLAIIEPFCTAGPLLANVTIIHILPAALGMILSSLAALGILLHIQYSFWNIGIDSMLLAFVYLIGLRILNNAIADENQTVITVQKPKLEKTKIEKSTEVISIRHAALGFGISAFFIVVAGVVLSYTGNQIAIITGLGGSFVGSILVAMSTSLPETAAGIAAVRIKAYNLAVGNYLGSNIFNMLIIAVSDIFYRNGPILANVEKIHVITCLFGLLLSGIVIMSLISKPRKRIIGLSSVSMIIIVVYFFATYILYKGISY